MVVVIQKPNCKPSFKTPYFFIVKYPFQKEDGNYIYIEIYNLNIKKPYYDMHSMLQSIHYTQKPYYNMHIAM